MKKLTNQHGDVLFYKMDALPKNLKKVPAVNGRMIFAEGEHTGHAHASVDNVTLFQDDAGVMFVDANESFTITHEEHNAQVIEPGVYEIGIVKEYDYDSEELRNVID